MTDEPVLLSLISEGATGPELAQPRSSDGHVRRDTVLAGQRCRRLSCRCHVADHQRQSVSRQPAESSYRLGQSSGNSFLPVYNSNRPEVHDVVAEMRAIIDSYPERVLIGEIYLPLTDLMAYYGQELKGANLPFNFLLLQSAWNAHTVAEIISEYMGVFPLGAWPNWVLGNHDNARIATRVGVLQRP